MRINESLNLVLPIRSEEYEVEEGGKAVTKERILLYAYHTPISKEVFEANFRILADVKTEIFGDGVKRAFMCGPMIATLALKDAGERDAQARGEAGDSGVSALRMEIKRLTLVMAPNATGWGMIPIDAAIANGIIDDEDWLEVEGSIFFFTALYSMTKRSSRAAIARTLAGPLQGVMTSSSPTEFAGSLQLSTPTETSATSPQTRKIMPSVPY